MTVMSIKDHINQKIHLMLTQITETSNCGTDHEIIKNVEELLRIRGRFCKDEIAKPEEAMMQGEPAFRKTNAEKFFEVFGVKWVPDNEDSKKSFQERPETIYKVMTDWGKDFYEDSFDAEIKDVTNL